MTRISSSQDTVAGSSLPADDFFGTPVIAGGGMVGLSLALLLARRGIAVRLLEAAIYPESFVKNLQSGHIPYTGSFDARNTALSRRTVEIYRETGLWDQLQQHATPIYQVHISEQGGFGKARLDHLAEGVESFGFVIENAWFGQVLLKNVLQNPLIQFHEGAKVTGLKNTPGQATLAVQQGEGTVVMETPLAIAADGRDSSLRSMLGIGASTRDYDQVAIVSTIETERAHQNIAYERFTPFGPLALLPLPGQNRRSVVWTVRAGEEKQWTEGKDEAFIQALEQAFGGRAGRVMRTAKRFAYPLGQVLASQQVCGRTVLAGNAAHTLHPVAGQGFNLCMRDIWALSAAVEQSLALTGDAGDSTIFRQYEQKRLIDQKRVITFCDAVVRGFSNRHPVLKLVRNVGLGLFETVPGIKPAVASYAMGLKF